MSLRLKPERKRGEPNPSLLLHPNIPKPLHGIAPRVIMGQEWWDKHRREAYANAGYCCEACGVPKEEAKYHKWLEAHEYYDYDYAEGTLTFVKLVALCHSCHNYIHSGRMAILRNSGEMTYAKYDDIMEHGDRLTEGHTTPTRGVGVADWEDWRLIFEGKEYGPSSNSYHEWRMGKWRNWKP